MLSGSFYSHSFNWDSSRLKEFYKLLLEGISKNWTSAIIIGSLGYNVHIANLTTANSVVIDRIF
jgi:hypothetical protein